MLPNAGVHPIRKSPPAAFSHRSEAQRVAASLSELGSLEGLFRSLRAIILANGYTKCGRYLLASSLAAALLVARRVSDFGELSRAAHQGWAGEKSGLFEHPEVFEVFTPSVILQRYFLNKPSFSAAC